MSRKDKHDKKNPEITTVQITGIRRSVWRAFRAHCYRRDKKVKDMIEEIITEHLRRKNAI